MRDNLSSNLKRGQHELFFKESADYQGSDPEKKTKDLPYELFSTIHEFSIEI